MLPKDLPKDQSQALALKLSTERPFILLTSITSVRRWMLQSRGDENFVIALTSLTKPGVFG